MAMVLSKQASPLCHLFSDSSTHSHLGGIEDYITISILEYALFIPTATNLAKYREVSRKLNRILFTPAANALWSRAYFSFRRKDSLSCCGSFTRDPGLAIVSSLFERVVQETFLCKSDVHIMIKDEHDICALRRLTKVLKSSVHIKELTLNITIASESASVLSDVADEEAMPILKSWGCSNVRTREEEDTGSCSISKLLVSVHHTNQEALASNLGLAHRCALVEKRVLAKVTAFIGPNLEELVLLGGMHPSNDGSVSLGLDAVTGKECFLPDVRFFGSGTIDLNKACPLLQKLEIRGPLPYLLCGGGSLATVGQIASNSLLELKIVETFTSLPRSMWLPFRCPSLRSFIAEDDWKSADDVCEVIRLLPTQHKESKIEELLLVGDFSEQLNPFLTQLKSVQSQLVGVKSLTVLNSVYIDSPCEVDPLTEGAAEGLLSSCPNLLIVDMPHVHLSRIAAAKLGQFYHQDPCLEGDLNMVLRRKNGRMSS